MKSIIAKRVGFAATVALAFPSLAHAHSFESGADIYASFLAGIWAVYADIGIVLLILAAGLLLALDKNPDKTTAFAALLIGAVTGCFLTVPFNVNPSWILLLSATLVACLASWRPAWPLRALLVTQAWAGGVGAWAVFAGHEQVVAPLAVYAGTLFALYIGVSTTGGLAKTVLEQIPQGWVNVAFRALSSWVAAIAIMTLAFVSTSAG